jgi:hypothetical protein
MLDELSEREGLSKSGLVERMIRIAHREPSITAAEIALAFGLTGGQMREVLREVADGYAAGDVPRRTRKTASSRPKRGSTR